MQRGRDAAFTGIQFIPDHLPGDQHISCPVAQRAQLIDGIHQNQSAFLNPEDLRNRDHLAVQQIRAHFRRHGFLQIGFNLFPGRFRVGEKRFQGHLVTVPQIDVSGRPDKRIPGSLHRSLRRNREAENITNFLSPPLNPQAAAGDQLADPGDIFRDFAVFQDLPVDLFPQRLRHRSFLQNRVGNTALSQGKPFFLEPRRSSGVRRLFRSDPADSGKNEKRRHSGAKQPSVLHAASLRNTNILPHFYIFFKVLFLFRVDLNFFPPQTAESIG